jgi:diacylglycerol kinase (ATP)
MKEYIANRIRSFGYAIRGIGTLVCTQPHARIHLLASLTVVGTGVYVHLRRWEWVAVLVCMGMVWMAEALNTALEFLADEVTLERRERIRKAKDVAAGAVLISAIIAVAVAAMVLENHLRQHR